MQNGPEMGSVRRLLLERRGNLGVDNRGRRAQGRRLGGEPVLHHLRTSLTFEVTMSLALDEE